MPVKRQRGDSIPVAQVTNAAPLAPIVAGTLYACWCNLKPAWYVAQPGDTVANVVAGLSAAITNAAETITEFTEFLPSISTDTLTLVLTATTPGIPFEVTFTTSGNMTVTESTAGGAGVNEAWSVALVGSYTGGTFTLTCNVGSGNVTTGNIAYNATAATVQAALVALSGVGTGQVIVTGSAAGQWFVTWTGSLGAQSIAAGTINGANLTGGATVVITETQTGNGLSDALQLIDIHDLDTTQAGKTYSLSFNGQVTSTLALSATLSQIQTALQSLPNIGSSNCVVLGNTPSALVPLPGGVVHFTSGLAQTNVSQLAVTAWTGTGAGPTISTIQTGGQTSCDEVQLVDFRDTSTDPGDVSLTVGAYSTGQIVLTNVVNDAAAIEAALQALPNVGTGNVVVTCQDTTTNRYQSAFTIHFTGALANTRMPLIVATATTGTPVVTRLSLGQANTNEVQTIAIAATGGTFTATAGAQTTSAIAYNASTSTVQTRLQTDLSTTITACTVTGSGTVAGPWVVTVTTPSHTPIALLTANPASLTGGAGKIAELVAGHAGQNEAQVLTAAAGTNAGTFTVAFGGDITEPIPYNAAAAAVQAALRTLASINTVTVSGSAGGPWTVTWSGAQASLSEPLLIADGTQLAGMTPLITQSTSTRSAGPNHWDDPTNWSPAGIPNSLDQVIFDNGTTSCLYGLNQIAPVVVNTTANNVCWAAGTTGPAGIGADAGQFSADQTVIVTSSGTLPSGITANTAYYLVNVNRDAGTAQLSTTQGGTPITLSSAGTGTITLGTRLASIELSARWGGEMGLARDNGQGYLEYRPRYLHIGLATVAAGGEQAVTIGTDIGNGAGKVQIDNDVDQAAWEVIQSGSSLDPEARDVMLKGTHISNTLEVMQGDVAVALFEGEITSLSSIKLRGGTLELGPGVTLTGTLDKTGGTLICDGCTIDGTVDL